jgi:hypothetical protein
MYDEIIPAFAGDCHRAEEMGIEKHFTIVICYGNMTPEILSETEEEI